MCIHVGAVPIWGGMRHLGEGAKISVFSQDLAQVGLLLHHDNSLSFHTVQHNTIAATMLTLYASLLTLYASMLTLYASSLCTSLGKTESTEAFMWQEALLPACVMSAP